MGGVLLVGRRTQKSAQKRVKHFFSILRLNSYVRNLPKTNADSRELAYESLMKYGVSRNYCNEYVFMSYRNHQHDMILLEGLPDVPSSLPHSTKGREKLGVPPVNIIVPFF